MGNSSDTNIRGRVLDATTLIPLGLFATAVVAVGGGSVWVTRIDARLSRIEEILQQWNADQWTAQDQAAWVAQLRLANPQIVVPEPKRWR